MRTVVQNDGEKSKPHREKKYTRYHAANKSRKGKSCFYDFAAENFAEFSRFEKGDDSEYIRKIGKMFRSL